MVERHHHALLTRIHGYSCYLLLLYTGAQPSLAAKPPSLRWRPVRHEPGVCGPT